MAQTIRLLVTLALLLGCPGWTSAQTAKKLVVGVVETCGEKTSGVPRTYIHALLEGGNIPLIVPCTQDTTVVDEVLKGVDVLMLVGGEDVSPSYYHALPSPHLGEVNDMRDSFEWLVLTRARLKNIPLLGTCRGLQVINVFYGGTLYQDLPTENPSSVVHSHEDMADRPTHFINIGRGSRLHEVLHAERIGVNSTHHQAVKDLAPGFRITATADDGVVEAIESDVFPVMAVQFHPERMVSKDSRFMGIYSNLLKTVKAKPSKQRVNSTH